MAAQGNLLIGAGTIINPILKVVTTVAILGAIYLFFVRPILDTTEDLADKGIAQVEQSQREAGERSESIALNSAQSRAESYANSLEGSWPAGSREVESCVRAAGTEVRRMERCADLGQSIVHHLQSDRNFAMSYANNLAARGDGADAARVRDCVQKAGFKAGPMQRCRDLADKLLFG